MCDILGLVRKICAYFFLWFGRKLVCTKTNQITDKASKHNGHTVILWAWVLLTRASTVLVSTSSFILNHLWITLSQNLRQLPFSPPPPQPTYFITTNRIRRPLSLGGHTKSYGCVSPRPPNKADKMTMTYPIAADLSANHSSSRVAYHIATYRIQQRLPPRIPQQISRHRQWVESTMYFPLY